MSETPAALPRNLRIARLTAAAAAFAVLGMGFVHFPMAYDLAVEPAFEDLEPAAIDLLILLCLCVGLLLLFVGSLALYFSARMHAGSRVPIFFLGAGALFFARTILELLHPVAIPKPDPMVLVAVFVTSVAFFTAGLLGRMRPRDA